MKHLYRFFLYFFGYFFVVVVPFLSGVALLSGGRVLASPKWNFLLFGSEVVGL